MNQPVKYWIIGAQVIIWMMTSITSFADLVPIYDIQYTTSPSGTSPMLGQRVTIRGTVTSVYVDGYIISDQSGPWHSIFVWSIQDGPQIGEGVEVAGLVDEFYGMTQLIEITDYKTHSLGNVVVPEIISVSQAASEEYESVLVRLETVMVSDVDNNGDWRVTDGIYSMLCGMKNDYMYFPQSRDILDSITGNILYHYGEFKLEPRDTMDIETALLPHYALKGIAVTMNSEKDIQENAYIEILGDRILSITSTAPSDILIINVNGLIFPGLINAHHHPAYGVLDQIPFPKTYLSRYEWMQESVYRDFMDQYERILNSGEELGQHANISKLTEVRALCSGTTSIQGENCNGHGYDDIAHQGMLINNVERFPNRVFSSWYPMDSEFEWRNYRTYQYWDRFIIHLSEGSDRDSLLEFYSWLAWGMLDERTTILNGIPFHSTEWLIMSMANASLVWSPSSNMRLYGTTADIPGALDAGIMIALGTDWTESGSPNLLEEMKTANALNNEYWSGRITPIQFAEFVTCNAAQVTGQGNRGILAPNHVADLLVIPKGSDDPYVTLLNLEPEQIRLMIVNGKPMMGDPDMMNQFPFITSDMEDISICGYPKKLAMTLNTAAIPDAGQSFYDILTELEQAYDLSEPKVCAFLNHDPCGYTPTPSPTPDPVVSPTPTWLPATATPESCNTLGVSLWMPAHVFYPDDPCSLEITICNPFDRSFDQVPLLIVLEIWGSYYFAPSFSDYDYYIIDQIPPGITNLVIIPPFEWPSDVGSAEGIRVYGAMTELSRRYLFGTYDLFQFSWYE